DREAHTDWIDRKRRQAVLVEAAKAALRADLFTCCNGAGCVNGGCPACDLARAVVEEEGVSKSQVERNLATVPYGAVEQDFQRSKGGTREPTKGRVAAHCPHPKDPPPSGPDQQPPPPPDQPPVTLPDLNGDDEDEPPTEPLPPLLPQQRVDTWVVTVADAD